MPNEVTFPLGSNLLFVGGVFVIVLVVFHIFLVYAFNLSKKSWARLDYAWLAITALSLAAAVAQTRTESAQSQLPIFEQRARAAHNNYVRAVELNASDSSPFCHSIDTLAETDPAATAAPPDQQLLQACLWFREFAPILRAASVSLDSYILEPWNMYPQVSDMNLSHRFEVVERQRQVFNRRIGRLEKLRAEAQSTRFEKLMMSSWPFLLAIAFALRITKVTGELRLAR